MLLFLGEDSIVSKHPIAAPVLVTTTTDMPHWVGSNVHQPFHVEGPSVQPEGGSIGRFSGVAGVAGLATTHTIMRTGNVTLDMDLHNSSWVASSTLPSSSPSLSPSLISHGPGGVFAAAALATNKSHVHGYRAWRKKQREKATEISADGPARRRLGGDGMALPVHGSTTVGSTVVKGNMSVHAVNASGDNAADLSGRNPIFPLRPSMQGSLQGLPETGLHGGGRTQGGTRVEGEGKMNGEYAGYGVWKPFDPSSSRTDAETKGHQEEREETEESRHKKGKQGKKGDTSTQLGNVWMRFLFTLAARLLSARVSSAIFSVKLHQQRRLRRLERREARRTGRGSGGRPSNADDRESGHRHLGKVSPGGSHGSDARGGEATWGGGVVQGCYLCSTFAARGAIRGATLCCDLALRNGWSSGASSAKGTELPTVSRQASSDDSTSWSTGIRGSLHGGAGAGQAAHADINTDTDTDTATEMTDVDSLGGTDDYGGTFPRTPAAGGGSGAGPPLFGRPLETKGTVGVGMGSFGSDGVSPLGRGADHSGARALPPSVLTAAHLGDLDESPVATPGGGGGGGGEGGGDGGGGVGLGKESLDIGIDGLADSGGGDDVNVGVTTSLLPGLSDGKGSCATTPAVVRQRLGNRGGNGSLMMGKPGYPFANGSGTVAAGGRQYRGYASRDSDHGGGVGGGAGGGVDGDSSFWEVRDGRDGHRDTLDETTDADQRQEGGEGQFDACFWYFVVVTIACSFACFQQTDLPTRFAFCRRFGT